MSPQENRQLNIAVRLSGLTKQDYIMPESLRSMRSHHVDEVKEILCAAGVTLLYLPPYSPDLNPIEMLWSKLKSILRKWAVRLAADLPDSRQENCQWLQAA